MAWSTSRRRSQLPPSWRQLRAQILRRDDWRCRIGLPGVCAIEATEVDHIVPGADHRPANLRSVCAPCHRVKTLGEAQAGRKRIRSLGRREEVHPGVLRAPRAGGEGPPTPGAADTDGYSRPDPACVARWFFAGGVVW